MHLHREKCEAGAFQRRPRWKAQRAGEAAAARCLCGCWRPASWKPLQSPRRDRSGKSITLLINQRAIICSALPRARVSHFWLLSLGCAASGAARASRRAASMPASPASPRRGPGLVPGSAHHFCSLQPGGAAREG